MAMSTYFRFHIISLSALGIVMSGCLPERETSLAVKAVRDLGSDAVSTPTPSPAPSATPTPTPAPTSTPTPAPTSTPTPTPTPTPSPAPTSTPAASPTPSPSPTGMTAGELNVWDRSSGYDAAVFLPKDYGSVNGKVYPLVISLHGVGGTTLNTAHTAVASSPEGFIRQLSQSSSLRDNYTGIVIGLHGRAAGVSSGDTWWNASLVHSLVLDAISTFEVDPDRVVVTGLSAGGSGTNDQIASYKSTYAGAMVVAWGPPTQVCELNEFPLWASGNSDDGTFNAYNWSHAAFGGDPGGYAQKLAACAGYSGEFQIDIGTSGGHSGWDTFYARSDVQTWLVNQTR